MHMGTQSSISLSDKRVQGHILFPLFVNISSLEKIVYLLQIYIIFERVSISKV